MKIVIALMQHETNTFCPIPTDYEEFGKAIGFDEPPSGQTVVETFAGTGMAIGAFLDHALRRGAEIVTPIAAFAEPGGYVADTAFETIAEAICSAVAEGCDAVLLDLHGAMVCETCDDPEGDLLQRLRQINPDVPIGVALDFHTNLTEKMVRNATVITGYRTYPHIDMYETGDRCARLIFDKIAGKVDPQMAFGTLPIVTAMLLQTPLQEPMKTPMTMAIDAGDCGRVLDASIFGGFPLSDIPHVSVSTVVVTDGPQASGKDLVSEILNQLWSTRSGFVLDRPEPLATTIATAKAIDVGPVVIADYGDNSGAGGPGDRMDVVAEVLKQGLENAAVGTIWDPEAVQTLQQAGIGATVTLPVGSKTNSSSIGLEPSPLTVTGTVKTLCSGDFVLQGDMMDGFPINMGECAVLQIDGVELIISSRRAEIYAPQFFTHVGIDPTQKRYLIIKSRQHFRAGFDPIASHILLAPSAGVCRENHVDYPYRNISRPIYPLDSGVSWPN